MNQERLSQILFSGKTQVFVVLDGALIPDLRMKLYRMEPQYHCLYRGALEPDIAEVAPYLVKLGLNTSFTEWLLAEGWGKNWGIFLHCPFSQIEVRRQLRSLLTVYDENGKPMLFRFYDPRVIGAFLPTCRTEELEFFFGRISNFFAESEDKESLIDFSLQNGELRSQSHDVK